MVCPAATSFAQALDWTAEVYRAAGDLMQEAGTLAGVADEGGWWPAFATNEQAIETLVARDRDAPASRPAARSPSRSTSPPRSSAAAANTSWRWRTRNWTATA